MSQEERPRVVAVYNARGSLGGEIAFLWGKARGTVHCGLCDISHGPVRRKHAWDALVSRLDPTVELQVRHLDELDPDQAAAVGASGAPVVLLDEAGADRADYAVLLGPHELDDLGGDVGAFEAALRERLSQQGLRP